MKVIPKVNFNEEFNGDLYFDLEVDLHGFFKVNFVFLNGNPLFLHLQSIEQKILPLSAYPSHRSIVTFQVSAIPEVFFIGEFNGDLHFDLEVDLHGFLKVKFVFF